MCRLSEYIVRKKVGTLKMKPVGFDQKIQFQHLDFLANALGTSKPIKLYEVLDDKLLGIIKGTMSRKHVITILMKIWVIILMKLKKQGKMGF